MKCFGYGFWLFVAFAGAASAEQFYKWQDRDGVWHYSKSAPLDQAAVTVNVSGSQRTQANTLVAPASVPTPPGAPVPAQPGRTSVEILKEVAAKRVANCEQAKANVATLENYALVTLDRDGDGKEETLTDTEQLAELEKARTQQRTHCIDG